MSKTFQLIPENDHWTMAIIGWKVTGLFLDGRFSLQVSGREREDEAFDSIQISIENVFNFSDHEQRASLDPEQPASLCPAISLLHKKVEGIAIYNDGKLAMTFEGERAVTVESDPQYEAWQITGPGYFQVIALPGGGLS